MNNPFSDPIRQQKFSELYNWGKSIGKTPSSAYFTAKSATLKRYPYTPHELHVTIKPNEINTNNHGRRPAHIIIDECTSDEQLEQLSLFGSAQTLSKMRE